MLTCCIRLPFGLLAMIAFGVGFFVFRDVRADSCCNRIIRGRPFWSRLSSFA
jgi:hypothetical protein